MDWKFWQNKDKEYLNWLYRKVREGVNPSYEPSIYDPLLVVTTGEACPRCCSDQIRGVSYSNRLQCKKCGKVFTK